MGKTARTAEPQCMQLHPVIVHSLCRAVSLIGDLPGHLAHTFARTGYDGHRIQHAKVSAYILGRKIRTERFCQGVHDMGDPVEPVVEGLVAAQIGKPFPQIVHREAMDLLYSENTLIVHGK